MNIGWKGCLLQVTAASAEIPGMLSELIALLPWWRLVWLPKNIPSHAFINWLAIKNKLTTRDRFAKWGIRVICCVFYAKAESRLKMTCFSVVLSQKRLWKSSEWMFFLQAGRGSWIGL